MNGVLLQGLPFQHPERIVDLNEVERRDIAGGGAIAPATFIDWRKMATSYDVMSVFSPRTYNVTPDTGEPARVRGTIASSSFFAVLGVSPILGRGFTPADAEPGGGQNIVLSFGFWQRQFAGKPDVINQTVRLNGQPYTIVGVMPATLNFPDATNFWVPSTHDVPSCGGPPNADPASNAARTACGGCCLKGRKRSSRPTPRSDSDHSQSVPEESPLHRHRDAVQDVVAPRTPRSFAWGVAACF